MNRFISLGWLFILALGLGCSLSRGDQASGDIDQFSPPVKAAAVQAAAVVRFEPATAQLGIGSIQAVEIRIDNVVNLAGADVQVQFNPVVLQVQDADPAKDGIQIQPGNFPAPDFVATNVVTNTSGVIQYAVVQIPPTQPVNGSGLLATINFQAVGQGSSDLTFSRTDLANSDAQAIPATGQAGQIVVGGPVITPSPTNTLLPGQPTATFTPIVATVTPGGTATPTATPFVVTATPTPQPTVTNTPGVPQVQIPPGATLGFCYRVQPGDTLYSLAQSYGTDPGFISLANDLYPPGHIYPQQVLFMPTAYGNGPNVYAVQAGDTLALVAERCQLKVELLAVVNGLQVDTNLSGIEKLIIPRPPFAPPSRYGYPQVGPPSVWPPPCSGPCN